MSTELEIRERQKMHLRTLLVIKKANSSIVVDKLDEALETAITPMSQEDIAWVEKIVGIKAVD